MCYAYCVSQVTNTALMDCHWRVAIQPSPTNATMSTGTQAASAGLPASARVRESERVQERLRERMCV